MAKIQNNKYGIAQTKHGFKIRGIVFGEKRQNFYTDDGKKRTVSFGVNINENKPIFCRLQGFTRDKVYFSNGDRTQPETIAVEWAKRTKAPKSGFEIIGIRIGLETDTDGKNVVKSMTEYDAAQYLSKNLHDGDSVVVIGDIEYYISKDGTVKRNYVPKQIYMESKAIDFSADDFKEKALFNQTLVFTDISKEQDEHGKHTGRFVLSGYDVAYQSVCNINFILDKVNANLAANMKKALKPFNAIDISGHIDMMLNISEENEDDSGWGTPNELSGKKINGPTRPEFIVDFADRGSIDTERYEEDDVMTAIKKINSDKEARKNFGDKPSTGGVSVDADDWGNEEDDDNEPW